MKTVWKYCYWLDTEAFRRLQERMEARGVCMVAAKQNPCEAIRVDIGYAAPEIWQVICKHDATPWYRASRHAGKYLIASSQPLDPDFQAFLATTITPVDFTPPLLPTPEQEQALIAHPDYRRKEPDGWGAFPKEMGAAIINGLAKMYGTPIEPFDDLLRTWTAVHANFAAPAFRADAAWEHAPYSIAPSVRISSGCVEFFNLIDSSEKALLVRPCIGGVIVTAFEKDRYYLVRPASFIETDPPM
ncbi:MAG: hypothetical protein N3B18_05775 [Desulfobacterota bacterium]|nr:hypothetical protein [Thermodesulfobacteriota bacterium]